VPYEIPNQLILKHLGDPCHVVYFSPNSFIKIAKFLNMRVQFIDACISKYDDRIIPVIRIILTNDNFKSYTINFVRFKIIIYYLITIIFNKFIKNLLKI